MAETMKEEACENASANLSDNILCSYKSNFDPNQYEEVYIRFKKYIDSSLDAYRPELYNLAYPIFVHLYLELVYNGNSERARQFMEKLGPLQEEYYQDDLKKLAVVTKREQMKDNEIIDNFTSKQTLFTVRLSRDSYQFLKRFLQDSNPQTQIIQNIIQEHLFLDIYEGLTRSKQQVESASGGMLGEANRQANKTKIYIGLLKEPEINIVLPDDDDNDPNMETNPDGTEKPKKKKSKRDQLLSKRSRNDPNAPPPNRIPLPELRDNDKLDKIQIMRESAKRLKLSAETLPSICLYTLLNASVSNNMAVICAEIAEDSSLLAAGMSDSTIKVWSLTPNKLRTMKSYSDLEQIDREVDDVLFRMMDDSEENSLDLRVLHGHSGPVYDLSISPDRTLLLSCSEDTTSKCLPIGLL